MYSFAIKVFQVVWNPKLNLLLIKVQFFIFIFIFKWNKILVKKIEIIFQKDNKLN